MIAFESDYNHVRGNRENNPAIYTQLAASLTTAVSSFFFIIFASIQWPLQPALVLLVIIGLGYLCETLILFRS